MHGIQFIKMCIQCRAKTTFMPNQKTILTGDLITKTLAVNTVATEIAFHMNPSHQITDSIMRTLTAVVRAKDETFLISLNPLCHCKFVEIQCLLNIPYSFNANDFNDFNDFNNIFSKQFDTKSCILRMICEARHYLLPPGKSLFQDIFRILFTYETSIFFFCCSS